MLFATSYLLKLLKSKYSFFSHLEAKLKESKNEQMKESEEKTEMQGKMDTLEKEMSRSVNILSKDNLY